MALPVVPPGAPAPALIRIPRALVVQRAGPHKPWASRSAAAGVSAASTGPRTSVPPSPGKSRWSIRRGSYSAEQDNLVRRLLRWEVGAYGVPVIGSVERAVVALSRVRLLNLRRDGTTRES